MTNVIDTIPEYFFYLEHQKQVTPGTLLTYKRTMQDFCTLYGFKDTLELTGSHIIRFKKHLEERQCKRKQQKGLALSTVNGTMIRFKAYLKWLADRLLIKNVRPADVPINKRAIINPTYLTREEIKILFEELDKRIMKRPYQIIKRDYLYAAYMLRAMVHLLYASGLRNAELRGLKMTDFNMNEMSGTVIGKGNRLNNFTFTKQAKEALLDFLNFKKKFYRNSKKHFDCLFTTANYGTQITATGLNVALRELGERTGLTKRLHAHVFRHTCATALLNTGVDLKTVQEKLCHVSIENTAIYLHVSNKKLHAATQGLTV